MFVFYYVQQEHRVYFWDYAGYWRHWETFYETFTNTPMTALARLLESVDRSDYNLMPVALISWVKVLPWDSRFSYILAIGVFYVCPLIFIGYPDLAVDLR